MENCVAVLGGKHAVMNTTNNRYEGDSLDWGEGDYLDWANFFFIDRLDRDELEKMRRGLVAIILKCKSRLCHFELDYISEKEVEERKQRDNEIVYYENHWRRALQYVYTIEQELQLRNKINEKY